jgi:arylsulfatase B
LEKEHFGLLPERQRWADQRTDQQQPSLAGRKRDKCTKAGSGCPSSFQWPGKVPAGKTFDRPVLSTDIFATIHAAAGAPRPKGEYIESYDLLPYLTGKYKEDPHEWLYWRQSHKTAFRLGDMKIVRQTPKKWELYNLSEDPSETKDLSKALPDQFESLLEGWEKINGNMVVPLFK